MINRGNSYFQVRNFSLGDLTTPWRWKKVGAHDLGDWLVEVRHALENGQQIDLSAPLPNGVTFSQVNLDDFTNPRRLRLFYNFVGIPGSVVAIQSGALKEKTHSLARQLGGRFSSIEEVEGSALLVFVRKIDQANTSSDKLKTTIEFSRKMMTGVNSSLPAPTQASQFTRINQRTKNPNIAQAANELLENGSSLNLMIFLTALKNNSDIHPFRRDLLNRSLQVLRLHSYSQGITLEEAAKQYQREFRHRGRPITYPKLIGTTLLVKGLEFDHAIILDAGSLSVKELYVALTRGAKSLTIISTSSIIPHAH